MKRKLENKPYFIILMGIFYLLSLTDQFYPILKAGDLLHPVFLLLIAINILLYITLTFIFPKLLRYALLLLYLQTVYFFYGPIQLFLKNNLTFLSHYRYLLPLLLVIALLLYFILRKPTASFSRHYLYLNTLLLILILMETGKVAIKNSNNERLLTMQKEDPIVRAAICDTCSKPDIYFIIFDGYSATRTLKQYWDYDNSHLDSFFRQHGFYYASQSKSNYNFTPYSLGSILNMDYHASSPDKIDIFQFCKGAATIKYNRVCEILKKNNYTIINQSFFPIFNDKPALDISYAASEKKLFFSQTLSTSIKNDIAWNIRWLRSSPSVTEAIAQSKIQFQQVQKAHNSLLETSAQKNKEPVFVYTHFLVPHDPYFYDSTGTTTPDTTWFYAKNGKERYLSQLKYINTIIKNLVTRLTNEATRPRVIIIQSDHGFRGFKGKELQQLEFNNLNAIYYPDQDYTQLHDGITSINTFPVIFNKYFHASIPLLKDSSIYIRH